MEDDYRSDDSIWYTPTGTSRRYPGVVADPRDGFELEIVHSGNVATTAHVTELEPRR